MGRFEPLWLPLLAIPRGSLVALDVDVPGVWERRESRWMFAAATSIFRPESRNGQAS